LIERAETLVVLSTTVEMPVLARRCPVGISKLALIVTNSFHIWIPFSSVTNMADIAAVWKYIQWIGSG